MKLHATSSATLRVVLQQHPVLLELVRGNVKRLHLLYLFYQVRLLVIELVVLGTIVVEPREKLDELLSITQKDFLDRTRLVWIRNKHLSIKQLKKSTDVKNVFTCFFIKV